MSDSLILAKLTVMLLRASLPMADSLGNHYGVVLGPGNERISLGEALERISELKGLFTFSAEVQAGNLVIAFERATPDDEEQVSYRLQTFDAGWRRLTATKKPLALVEARGFDDSMLVTVAVIEEWLHFANCRTCSLALSSPMKDSPAGVIAVLHLGSERKVQ